MALGGKQYKLEIIKKKVRQTATDIVARKSIFRCYGYRSRDGLWQAVCIDLNLAAQGANVEEVKKKLKQMIESYLESVFDTNDEDSISALLFRKAPIFDRIHFYLLNKDIISKQFGETFIFW